MHAKGMEVGGYDPRGAKGMALVYGCGPRGGCHHAGGYTVTHRAHQPGRRSLRRHRQGAHRRSAHATAGPAPPTRPAPAPSCRSACRTTTLAELIAGGHRPAVRGRRPVPHRRAGQHPGARDQRSRGPARRRTTRCPRRLIEEAVPEGPLAGKTVDFDLMRAEFYAASGLDPATSAADRRDAGTARPGMGHRRPGRRRAHGGGGAVSYYRDFREYVAALEADGLAAPHHNAASCKDTELMPLVRLQFRGLPAEQRTAFLFENVTDSLGRRYPGPGRRRRAGRQPGRLRQGPGLRARRTSPSAGREVHSRLHRAASRRRRARAWKRSTWATSCSSTTASWSSRIPSRRPASTRRRTSPRRSG